MDHDNMTDTIKAITKLLMEHYVFPETALIIKNELTQRLNNSEYDNFKDLSSFAELLTSQLQGISQDKHLQIRYRMEEPQVENTQEDNKIHHDNFLTMLRLDNYGFTKLERLKGNIGLLEFQAFMPPELAGETVSSAMTFLANTSCMIIDLRNNFGGSPYMVAFLSSYLLEPSPTHLNNLYWRKNDETQQFWSLPYVPGKRFGGTKPLYILTSRKTFSAAEEFTYNLQSIGRAIVVGERTGGGAHPGQMHRINRDFEMFIPNGRAINPVTKGNWEGVGVQPDIEVPQDEAFGVAYTTLLESELKRLSDKPISGYERLVDEIKQTLEKKGVSFIS
jgi:C-terminal processing protease CtpA/Prc